MDIKKEIAMGIADVRGVPMLKQRCPKDDYPMHLDVRNNLPFCGVCVTKAQEAFRAQRILLKAKIKELGLDKPDPNYEYKRTLTVKHVRDEDGEIHWTAFSHGMAL